MPSRKATAEILPPEVQDPAPLNVDNWLDGLTEQQRLFVLEYLTDLKVERAALAAGYAPSFARTQAFGLVSNPQQCPSVYRAVHFALEMRRRDLIVTADMVVREIAALALVDPRKAVKWRSHRIAEQDEIDPGDAEGDPDRLIIREVVSNTVELVPSDELDESTAKAIKEIRQDKDGNVTIKFHEKTPALALLARHLGLVNDMGEAARRMFPGGMQQIAHAGDAVNATAKQAAEGFKALMEGD